MRALLDGGPPSSRALTGGYEGPVRQVVLAGGCNCSRVSFIGACLGAKFGIDSIPVEWIRKTSSATHVLELAIQLVQL